MQTYTWAIWLIILGAEIISLLVVYLLRQERFDFFDPFYWVAIVYFAIMVFAPFTWVIGGKTHWYGAPVLENLPFATLLFGASYLAFFLSASSKPSHRTLAKEAASNQTEDIGSNPIQLQWIRLYSWVVFLIGLAGSIAYLRFRGRSLITALTLGQAGEFTESSDASLWFLNQGTRILFAGCMLLIVFGKKRSLFTILAYVLTFLIVLSNGQRNQLLVVVLAPIIYHYCQNKARPNTGKIMLFVLLFIVILGYIGLWRRSFRTGVGDLEIQSFKDIWESFMVNIEVFFPYYTMISTVPASFPHQIGLSYLYTFIQFIPRILWPGKPVSAVTNVTYAMFGAYASYGPAYPNFAEMYLDFSLPGMIVGMWIFARVCISMYRKGTHSNATKLDMLSFSLFLPYLFQYITRGHFPSVATEVFFLWGPIWGARFLFKAKKQPFTK